MQTNVLLHNVGVANAHELDTYVQRGGYQALRIALAEYQPEEITQIVLDSGLRGRGGAGFPAGRKWMFLPSGVQPRYLVCNADEGEPGTFKDRVLMEGDPHGVIEGTAIASYACQVAHAFIYVRGEYDLSYRLLRLALDQAYAAGFLGRDILGSGYDLELSILRGAGAYICGEETSLLSSLEGKRATVPRDRGALPQTDDYQQRRDPVQRALYRYPRGRLVPAVGDGSQPGSEAVLCLWSCRAAGDLRTAPGDADACPYL
jgi:NADH-quinone oxidoreductase subunit F